MPRLLVLFSKTDVMKFIGHLDLLTLFQRAINRAGLPVRYSQGFNPHQKVGFAAPLPLGVEGLNEVAEITLEKYCEPYDAALSLAKQMPRHLFIKDARMAEEYEKKSAALACAAKYKIRPREGEETEVTLNLAGGLKQYMKEFKIPDYTYVSRIELLRKTESGLVPLYQIYKGNNHES
ncbi:MAG: TIGR03936 family radical SAM-associated protein [Clostridiales bacterium]|jgi:radical SAM-linked protein|nr:TIGR03936 family radical SAM-associated protein [Clostridiales bacterium]